MLRIIGTRRGRRFHHIVGYVHESWNWNFDTELLLPISPNDCIVQLYLDNWYDAQTASSALHDPVRWFGSRCHLIAT